MIGRWLKARAARDETVLATKVAKNPGARGLRPANLRTALDASRERLGVETVDLYYAHEDDGGDLAESAATFDGFVRDGSIRAWGVSNFSAERIREVAATCAREGLAPPVALQPEYSLVERGFEAELQAAAAETGLGVVPYFALASGFLTGKYRPGGATADSARAGSASAYLEEPRGPAVLEALDAVAEAHQVPVASVALAWLAAQPTVVAPLASARTAEQVAPLAASIGLQLSAAELGSLSAASSIGVAA